METYDNHHDSGLGYGMLLCAMADALCFDLARGIKKGIITKDFQPQSSDVPGVAGQEALDALSFIKSQAAHKLCDWISEVTNRRIEPAALIRESVKRAGAPSRFKRALGDNYRDCRICGLPHRSAAHRNCWRCRRVKAA
jgi:hypothetical protein